MIPNKVTSGWSQVTIKWARLPLHFEILIFSNMCTICVQGHNWGHGNLINFNNANRELYI